MALRRITGSPALSRGAASLPIKILKLGGVFLLVSFIFLAGAAWFVTYRVTGVHGGV